MTRRLLTSCLGATLLAAATAGGPATAAQHYCDPLAGCASLKVKPSAVARGHTTRVYGSVAGGCQTPGTVTIYSRAFRGATRQSFAGVPALYVHASRSGRFSTSIRISRRVKPGRYHVAARCGGGNIGSATLHVI